MGLCSSMHHQTDLSASLRLKALQIFQKIDKENKGVIDKKTTQQFWQSNFAKINTEALFKAVDFDNSGDITIQEWLTFWKIVKKTGYTEQEINEELDELMQGKAWVQFRVVDQFIQVDKNRRRSQIPQIVMQEQMMTLRKTKTAEIK
ncbi:unnamed protein product [Paramecium sonneborni]|uniref:EF-hand domain-containing protein n=1 Tax=Paramecium sonneborni TaxID=65129 RepID=A0A8S1L022_9CILI|nr:unnamed protein product [Paramecium sonneborni]CAD8060968.1 unnamed protein product [Paramecium sonneborni]